MELSIIIAALAVCAFVFAAVGMCLGGMAWLELRSMKNSTHKFYQVPFDPSEPMRPVSPEELKATSVDTYDNIT